MSIFARLLERKVVDASNLSSRLLMGGGSQSRTGLTVTELTALRVTAVWACCRVICEDIGKIPLKLIREDKDGEKKAARDHPLYPLLAHQPNEWQTSMEWRMWMMLHALLAKGGYSFINRAPDGEVLELIPLMSHRVTPKQDARWNVTYDVTDANGSITTLRRDQVHVIHGLSWNGLSALELISAGREAIGLALAAEESQARLHGQGARPGGVITTEQSLSDPQVDKIKADFANSYAGIDNAFKTLLLDKGLEFKPWAMSGVDAQQIETRRFQVEECARLMRVFPSMIGYSDKATTYASAEAFFTAHVVHTLTPWVVNWEQAIARDLITKGERSRGLHAKFYLTSLLRGDSAARAAFYESAITRACWMTRNEARRLEDLNPIPGLDEMLTPMNMQVGAGDDKDPEPSIDDDEEDDDGE
jgi:HK97 family phage portal protein